MLMRGLLVVALVAGAGVAHAESVVVAGGSFSGQTRAGYAGVVLPLTGQTLSDGWSHSLFATGVRYEYPKDWRDVEGIASGLKYGLMRQFKVDGGSIGLGGGVALQHTGLSPDDPGNRNRGSHLRPLVELQWQSNVDRPWRSQLFSQYVFRERSNYVMAFVGHRLASGAALGPQLSSSGDPSYRVHGAALALRGIRMGAAEGGFHLGAQHLEGGRTQAEVGFSVVVYRP